MDELFNYSADMINNTDRACLFCDEELRRIFFDNSHFGGVYFCINKTCDRSGVLTIATKKLEPFKEDSKEEVV